MPDDLHDRDFYAWTQQQARALRTVAALRINVPDVDLDHLAEEVEDMGKAARDALESDLARVIEHLLKLEHSPAPDPRRQWRLSVSEHRDRIADAVEKSGTLAAKLPDILPRAWSRARRLAALALREDGIGEDTLPVACPYTLERVVDFEWWP